MIGESPIAGGAIEATGAGTADESRGIAMASADPLPPIAASSGTSSGIAAGSCGCWTAVSVRAKSRGAAACGPSLLRGWRSASAS